MKGEASPLVKFFNGYDKRFVIPLYQRNYSWQEKQCRQLFEDLLKVHREKKESHFFGSIVSQTVCHDQYIIDGQQRLTTIALILTALVNGAKKGNIIFHDLQLTKKIYECFLVDIYKDDERKIKLKPVNKDLQAFDALVCRDDQAVVKESNVTRNYRYFYDQIMRSGLAGDDIFHAIEKLMIIDIQLDEKDDPQLIFESLNSTGLDLSEADKIRNYLLMSVPVKMQEKLYNQYWRRIETNAAEDTTAFIRDFLTAKTQQISRTGDLYFVFKDYVEKRCSSREVVLADMEKASVLYRAIRMANLGLPKTDRRLKRLCLLEASVLNPFELAFFAFAQEHDFSDEVCARVMQSVESYLVRRLFCQCASNAHNKVFARLHHDVVKNLNGATDGETYRSVFNFVLSRKSDSAAFPDDDEFRVGFATRQLYRVSPAGRNFVLERLENRDCKETHDVKRLLEEQGASIEHIMPQTLSEEWKKDLGPDYERVYEEYLHTIANLTLTGYNSEYSNLPFLTKKTMPNGFCDGTYRLSSFLRKDTTVRWTEEEILARQKELFNVCLQLWPMPVSDYVPQEHLTETEPLSEESNCTGRKLCGYSFLGTHNDVKSWKEMLCQVARRCLQEHETSVLYCCDNNKYGLRSSPLNYYDEFAPGRYAHVWSSTAEKLWMLQMLLKECGIPLSELVFEFQSNTTNRQDVSRNSY